MAFAEHYAAFSNLQQHLAASKSEFAASDFAERPKATQAP